MDKNKKSYFFDGVANSSIKHNNDSRNSQIGYLNRGFEPKVRRNTNSFNNYK